MEEELRKEYFLLFNGISKTIETLEDMIGQLKTLQQEAENYVLEEDVRQKKPSPIHLGKKDGEKLIHLRLQENCPPLEHVR